MMGRTAKKSMTSRMVNRSAVKGFQKAIRPAGKTKMPLSVARRIKSAMQKPRMSVGRPAPTAAASRGRLPAAKTLSKPAMRKRFPKG